MKAAADTLKRVTLELGGKSPNIVFADADLDAAVDGAILGLYLNQGQCCCAGSRLFVQEPIYEKMVEKLAASVKTRKLGDPFDPATEQGPAGRQGPVREDPRLHRQGQGPGCQVRHRRRALRLAGLLHQADRVLGSERLDGDRQGRDLRAR